MFSTASAKNDVNANAEQVKDTTVLGKLYFVNLKEGEKPVMTGLSLHGNLAAPKPSTACLSPLKASARFSNSTSGLSSIPKQA